MKLIFSILILVTSVNVVSQNINGASHLFEGSLLNHKSENPVEYAALKNMSTGEVVLTNELGLFEINGSVGDTIRFHSLGYKDTTWIIPSIWMAMEEDLTLEVETSVYSIAEVEVLRFYSYAHFKQAFKDLKLPKDENEEVKMMVASWNFEEAIAWGKAEKKAKEGAFGASLSSGRLSKEDAQKALVKKLERVYDDSYHFREVTGRENLASLTGYQGVCLDSFIVFLNSNYSINYKMTDLTLITSIMDAYKDFKELKNDQEWYDVIDSTSIQ
ncbi:hypothetical protein [Plebeiibacterium marinum]|uniref:Carboxypeptidase-like regulatory domain-containing protein n=1 Tax=Plebeiibacterium marinum TaxID=2992111 RepID=A0AAE3MCH6_9BACT|nr:hypothetical protein [Plebeiobacterium marinum]MCW3805243.1 hypothetical protein [Plebeiobacterium marinum]